MYADDVSSTLRFLGSSCGNVTRLTLGSVFVSPLTLAMFLSRFPRLDDLSIHSIRRPIADDGSSGSYRGFHAKIVPTHPRGEYYESGDKMYQAERGIYKKITLLEPRFRKISLRRDDYDVWRDYWPLLEACGGSLEELHILGTASGE